MYKPVKYIATIKDENKDINYFYQPQEKRIIPIEHIRISGGTEIYTTFEHVLVALKASIEGITVYKRLGDSYYSYLSIKRENTIYDINIDLEDAIKIANTMDIQIGMASTIVDMEGFVVTKDLIREAISGDECLRSSDAR